MRLKFGLTSFIFTVFILFSGNSQDLDKEQLKEVYSSHFKHHRETIHLHLNKTHFFQGEEVWWTAYAFNKKSNSPSTATANLYCGLYDDMGRQVIRKLFLVENGVAHGSFKIDSTFTTGTYFVKAETTWMKNFEKEEPYVQKITIVNDPIEVKSIASPYDLQILPEGGYLITEATNTVGVRLTDQNGRGVKILKGEVLENGNTILSNVSTNTYGVGRFKLLMLPEKSYVFRATLQDGSTMQKKLPIPEEKGIAMSINNILGDKLIISLNTNTNTLEEILGDKFYLAMHRDGLMTLKSFEMDSKSRTLKIDKNKLLPGTNIVTLFNQNLQPISERLIFNYHKANIATASVSLANPTKRKKDSIGIKIDVLSKNKTPMSLSISALPNSSIANTTSRSIVHGFLLGPYLKTPVEDSNRYFSEITRIKEYELDLILLTQGWSRYDWKDIFEGEPAIEHPFEFGVHAVGKLNTRLRKGESLALLQKGQNPMLFLELKDSTDFTITDLLLQNGDKMKFAIKKKRGGLRKPSIDINFQGFGNDMDSITAMMASNKLLETFPSNQKEEQKVYLVGPQDLIKLDEVVLTEERKEKQLIRKHPLVNESFRGFKIGEKEIRRNVYLLDFIEKNGFFVDFIVQTGAVVIRNRKPNMGQTTILTSQNTTQQGVFANQNVAQSRNVGSVRVYDDDFLVNDLTQLLNVPLNQIDEVYIETDGLAGDSFDSSGGVIRIYRKEGASTTFSSPAFVEKLVENSFARPKEFYRPKYVSSESTVFENFGVLHWEPQLITNKDGETELKIPNSNLPSVRFFIEGMGEDGTLLSHTQEVFLN